MKSLIFFLTIFFICNFSIICQGQTNLKKKLFSAAKSGKTNKMEKILNTGMDLETTDNIGQTPLHIASIYGRPKVVELLLSKGANPNTKDNLGRTPMFAASSFGHNKIVNLLEQYNAKGIKGKSRVGYVCFGWSNLKRGMTTEQVKKCIGRYSTIVSTSMLALMPEPVIHQLECGTLTFKSGFLIDWKKNY